MAAYQLQYNNILNASIPPSIGNTVTMSTYAQELARFQPSGPIGNTIPISTHTQELAGFQPYGTIGNNIPMSTHTQGLQPYSPLVV
jgi:hypothetical protein